MAAQITQVGSVTVALAGPAAGNASIRSVNAIHKLATRNAGSLPGAEGAR